MWFSEDDTENKPAKNPTKDNVFFAKHIQMKRWELVFFVSNQLIVSFPFQGPRGPPGERGNKVRDAFTSLPIRLLGSLPWFWEARGHV